MIQFHFFRNVFWQLLDIFPTICELSFIRMLMVVWVIRFLSLMMVFRIPFISLLSLWRIFTKMRSIFVSIDLAILVWRWTHIFIRVILCLLLSLFIKLHIVTPLLIRILLFSSFLFVSILGRLVKMQNIFQCRLSLEWCLEISTSVSVLLF